MNRCASFLACVLALAALAPAWGQAPGSFVGPTRTPNSPAITVTTTTTAVPAPADGVIHRKFPQNALRGKVVFGVPPAIELDGNAVQMAGGYRIHGYNNLLLMSAQLTGIKAIVDYTTDVHGQPREIWLLTDAEAANKPWPRTPAEAAAWAFDPTAQTWTKP